MKITNLTHALLFSLLAASQAGAVQFTVDFEDLTVPDDGYYIGDTDGDNTFVSGGVTFTVDYNATYGSWSGIAYSNVGGKYESAAPSYADQFNQAVPGIDFAPDNFGTYAVVYYPGSYGDTPSITLPDGMASPVSMKVNNDAYAYGTILFGDSYGFSDPFATGDYFTFTATGYDSDDNATGSVTFYLADYTSSTEDDHYAISGLTDVDLTSLGDDVRTIKFTMSSSDSGDYGINTPAYFIIDDLVIDSTTYLWTNAGAWSEDSWYGDVYAFQNGEGWIYSSDNHAYQYAAGDANGVWIYDLDLGWCWTSDDNYPYIYIFQNDVGWAYFYQGSGEDSEHRVFCIWNDSFATAENYPYVTVLDLTFMSVNE